MQSYRISADWLRPAYSGQSLMNQPAALTHILHVLFLSFCSPVSPQQRQDLLTAAAGVKQFHCSPAPSQQELWNTTQAEVLDSGTGFDCCFGSTSTVWAQLWKTPGRGDFFIRSMSCPNLCGPVITATGTAQKEMVTRESKGCAFPTQAQSQNSLGQKRPLKIVWSNHTPTSTDIFH